MEIVKAPQVILMRSQGWEPCLGPYCRFLHPAGGCRKRIEWHVEGLMSQAWEQSEAQVSSPSTAWLHLTGRLGSVVSQVLSRKVVC